MNVSLNWCCAGGGGIAPRKPYAQTEGGREGWADPCGFLRVSLCRGFGTESRAEPPLASREVGAGPAPSPCPGLLSSRPLPLRPKDARLRRPVLPRAGPRVRRSAPRRHVGMSLVTYILDTCGSLPLQSRCLLSREVMQRNTRFIQRPRTETRHDPRPA